MMGWRDTCDSTIRLGAQFLSRGQPSFTDGLAEVTQSVVLGNMTPEAAAEQIQQGLNTWYTPQQKLSSKLESSSSLNNLTAP
jgi:raffinose/stachyose/melibiose transport system substrate-binding protein